MRPKTIPTTAEVYQIADLLHSLFCVVPHTTQDPTAVVAKGRSCNECYYYLEDQFSEAWELPDHAKWLQKAAEIKALSKLESSSLISVTFNMEQLVERPDLLTLLDAFLQFLRDRTHSRSPQ